MQQIPWKSLPDEMWNRTLTTPTEDIEADCLVLKQQLATVKRYLDGIVESVRTREPLSRLNWRHRSVDRSGLPEAVSRFADPKPKRLNKNDAWCVSYGGSFGAQGWENSICLDWISWLNKKTRWWQLNYFWKFHPIWGRFPTSIFQRGWNHQPEKT